MKIKHFILMCTIINLVGCAPVILEQYFDHMDPCQSHNKPNYVYPDFCGASTQAKYKVKSGGYGYHGLYNKDGSLSLYPY